LSDPQTISEFVLAAAAVISTATPIVIARRRASIKNDQTVLASFTALNEALSKEVERLQGDMVRLRGDYEQRLTSAMDQIRDLQSEVATLQRLLSKRGDTV
jgi:DNA anti-recombination protein RmuC